jgi:hypothetical protein
MELLVQGVPQEWEVQVEHGLVERKERQVLQLSAVSYMPVVSQVTIPVRHCSTYIQLLM